MSALTMARGGASIRYIKRDFRPMAAGAKLWPGAGVVAFNSGGNSGYYAQAQTATNLVSVGAVATGRAATTQSGGGGTFATGVSSQLAGQVADNTAGAAGALWAEVEYLNPFYVRLFKNDTGTPVTAAMREQVCYWLDDQTVTGSSTGTSVSGVVYDVTSEGVWVRLGSHTVS